MALGLTDHVWTIGEMVEKTGERAEYLGPSPQAGSAHGNRRRQGNGNKETAARNDAEP
jgi:hypothetical protein